MFEIVPACTEFVSPLWAMIFGAGEACIRLSFWTVLQSLVPFAVAVFLIQTLIKRLVFRGAKRADTAPRPEEFRPKTGQRVAGNRPNYVGD